MMTDRPPCDRNIELCPDAPAGNETVAADKPQGGLDLGKIALLAVGGTQAAAGVLTLMDETDITPMSIVNTAFGALGVFLGVHQLFLAQPSNMECPPPQEKPHHEEEGPAEEVAALRQDPMTEEAPVEEQKAG